LPLPDFPKVIMGVMWRGRTTPLLELFLEELRARARRFGRS
jgi:hypothetical protein